MTTNIMSRDEIINLFSKSGINFAPRQNYEFVNSIKYSQHLPIEFSLHKQFINSLNNLNKSKKIEVDAYPSEYNINNNIIKKIQKKFNIDFSDGCFSYKISPHPKTYSNFVVISTLKIPITNNPYTFILRRLVEYDTNYFLLEEFKPTFLKLDETDYSKLSLSAMHNSIREVSSLSNSEKDKHIINSIIANYIGSDVMKNAIDGIGSSYQGTSEMKNDLKIVNRTLSEPSFGIPIQDFGILNFFDKPIDFIQKLRDSCKRCRTISFNNEAVDNATLKESEFKYATGVSSLDIHSQKNLENNIDFRESLILYNIMNRPVSSDLRGKVITAVSDEIIKWFDKGLKNEIYRIYALKELPIQIPKIASYFLSFEKKEKDVIELVKTAVSHNISDMAGEMRRSGFLSDDSHFSSKKLDREKRIEEYHMKENILLLDPEVIKAVYLSDRTEQNIIKNIMDVLKESEEKAMKRFNLLHSTGIIFSPDKVHYYFIEESNLK